MTEILWKVQQAKLKFLTESYVGEQQTLEIFVYKYQFGSSQCCDP